MWETENPETEIRNTNNKHSKIVVEDSVVGFISASSFAIGF